MQSRHLRLPEYAVAPRPHSQRRLAAYENDRRLGLAGIYEEKKKWASPARKREYMAAKPERSEVGRIALVAWDTVAAFRRYVLKEKNPPLFHEAPETQRQLWLQLIEVLIANPGVNAPMLHKHWCGLMQAQGWRFGEKLDVEKQQHPSLCDWRFLSEDDHRKDMLIISTVQTLTGFA